MDDTLEAVSKIKDFLREQVKEDERKWRKGDFKGWLHKPKSAFSDKELARIRSEMELVYVREKKLVEELSDFIDDNILTFDDKD